MSATIYTTSYSNEVCLDKNTIAAASTQAID